MTLKEKVPVWGRTTRLKVEGRHFDKKKAQYRLYVNEIEVVHQHDNSSR